VYDGSEIRFFITGYQARPNTPQNIPWRAILVFFCLARSLTVSHSIRALRCSIECARGSAVSDLAQKASSIAPFRPMRSICLVLDWILVSQKNAKYISIKAFVTSQDVHSNLNKHRRAVSVPRTPQYPGPQNHGYLEVPVYFNHLQTSLNNPYQSLALLLRHTYATHNRLLRDLRVSPDPYLLDIHSERPMMGSLSLGQEATPCKLCLWADSAPQQWQLPSFF
jgi:hypothetical protein